MLSPEPAIPKNQTGGSTQVCYNRVSSKLLLTPSGHTGSIRLPHAISVALMREDLESGMHYLPPAVGSRLLRSEFRFVVQLVQPADQTAAIRRGYGDHSPSPTFPGQPHDPGGELVFRRFRPGDEGNCVSGPKTPFTAIHAPPRAILSGSASGRTATGDGNQGLARLSAFSSGVGEGIHESVVQSDGEFLRVGVSDRQ